MGTNLEEVGSNIKEFQIGDRVFGGAPGRAVADYIVLNVSSTETLHHTPSGISDVIASALPVAGLAADAALSVIGVTSDDTVLIGVLPVASAHSPYSSQSWLAQPLSGPGQRIHSTISVSLVLFQSPTGQDWQTAFVSSPHVVSTRLLCSWGQRP